MWQQPQFDQHAFSKHPKAVSAKSKISFQDYGRMHVTRHKSVHVRRLPTPNWAINDTLLRERILLYVERRFSLRPDPTLSIAQRLERITKREQAGTIGLRARLYTGVLCYRQMLGDHCAESALSALRIQIANWDKQLVMAKRGSVGIVNAVVYLYYRLGWDSVGVAQELGLTSPHVRQILARLHLAACRTQSSRFAKSVWSDEEKQALFQLRADGVSWSQIAEKLGLVGASGAITRSAYTRFFGKPEPRRVKPRASPTWPEERKQMLFQMRTNGATWKRIAKAVGVSASNVAYNAYTRFFGKPESTHGSSTVWTDERKQTLFQLRTDGDSWKVIATKLGYVKAVSSHKIVYNAYMKFFGKPKRHATAEVPQTPQPPAPPKPPVRNAWTFQRKQTLFQLRAAGASWGRIAKAVGLVGGSTAYYTYVKFFGVPEPKRCTSESFRTPAWTDERKQMLSQLRADGDSWNQIAKELGLADRKAACVAYKKFFGKSPACAKV